jgi:DnaK suppressor protein
MPTKKGTKKTAKKKSVKASKKSSLETSAKKKKTAVKTTVKKKAMSAQKAKTTQAKKAKAENAKETLRRLLIEKRENIVKEAQTEIAKYIKGENRQLVETALDEGDWSVIDLSEDINLRKLGTHRETLLKIDESLRKLEEGTYGICEDCGEEINAERLKILPFAICCRDCQEKREELEAVEREEEFLP